MQALEYFAPELAEALTAAGWKRDGTLSLEASGKEISTDLGFQGESTGDRSSGQNTRPSAENAAFSLSDSESPSQKDQSCCTGAGQQSRSCDPSGFLEHVRREREKSSQYLEGNSCFRFVEDRRASRTALKSCGCKELLRHVCGKSETFV